MLRTPGIEDNARPRTQLGAPSAFRFSCSREGAATSMSMKQKSPHNSQVHSENRAAFV